MCVARILGSSPTSRYHLSGFRALLPFSFPEVWKPLPGTSEGQRGLRFTQAEIQDKLNTGFGGAYFRLCQSGDRGKRVTEYIQDQFGQYNKTPPVLVRVAIAVTTATLIRKSV